MNIFGFITIGLVFVSVLLIYYVELPRLRSELNDRLDLQKNGLIVAKNDLFEIRSARGTFSRQLDEEKFARITGDNQAYAQKLELQYSVNQKVDTLIKYLGIEYKHKAGFPAEFSKVSRKKK
jgi:hypothetical protein